MLRDKTKSEIKARLRAERKLKIKQLKAQRRISKCFVCLVKPELKCIACGREWCGLCRWKAEQGRWCRLARNKVHQIQYASTNT